MKNSYRSILSMLLAFTMVCLSILPTAYAADNIETEATAPSPTVAELAAYQDIIDKLNEEYGYSMAFAPAVFSRDNTFETPTRSTLAEFEAELRKDIEEDIAVNAEAKEAIAALGNVEWTSAPFTGNIYTVPANVSYLSSQVMDVVYEDAVSYISDAREAERQTKTRASDQTLTSVQPKLDPTGNLAFLLNTTISIPNYWKYASVSGFSFLYVTGYYPIYSPTAMSYSYLDSMRTVAATFTCTRYNESGVVINKNTSVYREFHATSDCITNSPNYTISKTYTNKTYNLIDHFDSNQNCAGYAWNHYKKVDMGTLGINYAELNKCSSLSALSKLVKDKSETYMSNHGITANSISSYDTAINTSTQYRVVMRVGYYDTNGNGKWDFSANPGSDTWDYHWWMQLGDGTWADKRGDWPSRIVPNSNIYSNPDTILWSLWSFGEVLYNDFYNSTPVYYKITG